MKKLMFIIVLIALSVMTASCVSKPEGSVLKFTSAWNSSHKLTQGEVTYTRLTVTAIISNVGGEGTFYVNAEITPHTVVSGSVNPQKIKVLMNKAQEKTYTFDFFVDMSADSHYNVWCTDE